MANSSRKSLDLFIEPLTSLGKTLDEFLNEISFEPNAKTTDTENANIIVKNEILSVVNKSKINPKQFASMILMNNIYIENEKPGDWTRLKTYEVEEMMNNMRNEIIPKDKQPESLNYNSTIHQRFE
jgi:hypothetical protein